MTRQDGIEIFKEAILLEHRGRALYESAAAGTASQAVKELFRTLQAEEEKHIEILSQRLKSLFEGADPGSVELGPVEPGLVDRVLNDRVVSEISAAGYEAAVISAALDFEKRAVTYYGEQADRAQGTESGKLFQWLHDWEISHLSMLAGLDSALREKIWYDNSFWPLD